MEEVKYNIIHQSSSSTTATGMSIESTNTTTTVTTNTPTPTIDDNTNVERDAMIQDKELIFLFRLLIQRFNLAWSSFDQSSQVAMYLSMAEPSVVVSAESLIIAKGSTKNETVMNCVLPIAEMENRALELVIDSMRSCHIAVERTYEIMNRILALDPELEVVKSSLDPLAVAFTSLQSCEGIIKTLVQMKIQEVKQITSFMGKNKVITKDNHSDFLVIVDQAHCIEMLFNKGLKYHLKVAMSISEKLQELAVESAGSVSLAYWRGVFEETKSDLENALCKLEVQVKNQETAEEPYVRFKTILDMLSSHIVDEKGAVEILNKMRSSILTQPMKVESFKEQIQQNMKRKTKTNQHKKEAIEMNNVKKKLNNVLQERKQLKIKRASAQGKLKLQYFKKEIALKTASVELAVTE